MKNCGGQRKVGGAWGHEEGKEEVQGVWAASMSTDS